MGGWGSGRQNGQLTIGACGSYRLALKELGDLLRSPANRAVWLNYGQGGDERMTVVVEARPEHGYIRLQHPSRASGRTKHMDYTVGLISTKAGFGGRRWWFSCPTSSRRCAVLYLPRGARQFGSAKGYCLAYSVTRMEEHDRLWHRMGKIAGRLGDRDPDPEIPPRRPKWMHTVVNLR